MQTAAFLERAWQQLTQGARDSRHPFRYGVLATLDEDGVDARTLVLRSANPGRHELCFHSDLRSAKLSQLRRDPRVCFVAHSLEWQVRAYGRISIQREGIAVEAAWDSTSADSKALYGSREAPGAALSAQTEAEPAGEGSEDLAQGRRHFVLLRLCVDRLDVLQLDRPGHRRARYELIDQAWQGEWCAP